MAEIIIYDYTLYVPVMTNLSIFAAGKQSYSKTTGSIPWQLSIYFDGTLINFVGGATAYTDSPSVLAAATGVAAGNHSVRLGWYGDTSLSIRGLNMIIDGNYK